MHIHIKDEIPTIYITLSGGVVAQLLSDLPANVFIIDEDNGRAGEVEIEECNLVGITESNCDMLEEMRKKCQ
jgi:Trk K+ transport system NAD-binding subunit